MLAIRAAAEADLAALCRVDPRAEEHPGHGDFLAAAVAGGNCYVALEGDRACGYLVFDHSFFGEGFVHTLYVAADARRRGVGAALMAHAENLCQTPKLFTSTNLSNHPMQALLAKLGYKLSGVIHDLDEGDPELIYVKYLTAN